MNTSTETWTWMWIGTAKGAKWGFFLAVAYSLWFFINTISTGIAADMLEQLANGSTPTLPPLLLPENTGAFLLYLVIAMGGGGIVGGIPAAIIGGVSGMGLGGLLSHHLINPSPIPRFIVSAVFGIMGALLINLIGSKILLATWEYKNIYPALLHWQYIGLPSIVYIGVCLIMSQQLPLWVERTYA